MQCSTCWEHAVLFTAQLAFRWPVIGTETSVRPISCQGMRLVCPTQLLGLRWSAEKTAAGQKKRLKNHKSARRNPKTRNSGVIEQKRQNWTNSILRGSEWLCLPYGRRSNWRSGSRKHYDKLTARMRWHGVLSLVSRCDTYSTLVISSYHTDFIVSYSDFVIWGAEPESEGTRTARTHCLWQR